MDTTSEEAVVVAKAMDLENKIDWVSNDHHHVEARNTAISDAMRFVAGVRALSNHWQNVNKAAADETAEETADETADEAEGEGEHRGRRRRR